MLHPPRRNRFVLPLVAGFALAAAGGGSGEGIRSYTVPKTTSHDRRAATEYRILGAVYPAANPTWFFKFTGTADQIAAHEAAFDAMAASVKLQADLGALPTFTVPAGWK